jgi:internalin A
MYELFEVWRNSRRDDEAFLRRIRVFRLPDAAMMTPVERARCAKFWKDQFIELDQFVRAEGADLLGQADFGRYKLMQDFAHRIGDILSLIADTLLPRDFDQLLASGFGDPSS